MADDYHNFRVKFEDGSEDVMGWSRHELRNDSMVIIRIRAREQEEEIAKLEKREPRKIASVDRIYP